MSRDTRDLLADAVRFKHKSLDQQVLLRKLVSENLALAEYSQVLQALRTCYCLLEPGLAAYERSYLQADMYAYIPKCAALDLDLQQLGEALDQVTESIAPVCIDNPGAYLGARYVLEGSTQGGVFIASCLEKSLPELSDIAFRFWTLQRHTAKHWPAFLLMLAWLDGDSAGQGRAIQAAQHSFDIFLSVFATVNHV